MNKISRSLLLVTVLGSNACSSLVTVDRSKVEDDLYMPTKLPDAGEAEAGSSAEAGSGGAAAGSGGAEAGSGGAAAGSGGVEAGSGGAAAGTGGSSAGSGGNGAAGS
jgi:hypothetical protein